MRRGSTCRLSPSTLLSSGPWTQVAGGEPALRTSKTTRVELPLKLKEGGRLDRAALHFVADEGLIGGPAFTWLFTRRGLRGTKWIDPWHRIWNDTKVACRACNLWTVVQEYTVVFNMLRAPFSGSGFYQALRTSGKHFFKTSSFSNPLYGSLYD